MRVQFIRLPRSRRGRVAEIEKAELIRTDKGNCPVLRIADKRMRSRSLRIGKEMLVRADKGDCPAHRIADRLIKRHGWRQRCMRPAVKKMEKISEKKC